MEQDGKDFETMQNKLSLKPKNSANVFIDIYDEEKNIRSL